MNPKTCQMKEKNNKLSLTFEGVSEVEIALKKLHMIKTQNVQVN